MTEADLPSAIAVSRLNGCWLEKALNRYLPWKSVRSMGIHFPFKVDLWRQFILRAKLNVS
jgi:hypothetical protein